jgi:hypothetical protein
MHLLLIKDIINYIIYQKILKNHIIKLFFYFSKNIKSIFLYIFNIFAYKLFKNIFIFL